ncbi:hypothetical protein M3J09_003942 [Ascochyta lentis]
MLGPLRSPPCCRYLFPGYRFRLLLPSDRPLPDG